MPRLNPPRVLGGEANLARRVTFERERRGWTTESLARRMTDAGCPINQSAIWKIENGEPRRRITYDEAVAFAEVFEIPLTDLAQPPEELLADAVRELAEEYQAALDAHVAALHRLQAASETARAVARKMPELAPYLDRLCAAEDVPADVWHLRAEIASHREET